MDERTQRFVDLVVESALADRAQADECLRILETVREVGLEQKIEEIFVKKGYLTPDQAHQLSRKLSAMKVGKYQILEKLGEGGAGIVYKANQEPLDRLVAIKLLSRRRTSSERYLERFLREARIAVTLNHQNIVRGLDYGEEDGYHYYVMEYVEGESLHEVLKREGTLDEKPAFRIALQTVHALQHAAKYDLVHRDIKPENILVMSDGTAKLCDLGLAKPTLVETAQASKDGVTIGTPTYMSPEQIRGRDETDFRSDVYSLGATLYHVVAGRPPFKGPSSDVVVRKHLREQATDPRDYTPGLSNSATAVILKMLAKKPVDRYSTLDDLEEDLQAVLDGRPPRHTIQMGKKPAAVGPIDVAEVGTRRTRMAKESKRKSLVTVLVVLGILVLAAGGMTFLSPFAKKGDGAGEEPGPDAGVPGRRAEEEADLLAEEMYKEAQEYRRKHPESSFEARIERFELVTKRYPGTRWTIDAKERIRELREEKQAGVARHLEAAEKAYDELLAKARTLATEKRFGEALRALADYPEEFAETKFPDQLRLRIGQFSTEATEAVKRAIDVADLRMKSGRYEDAEKLLAAFDVVGIPELVAKISEKQEAIRTARKEEEEARARWAEKFRSVVGAALVKAGSGDYSAAVRQLVEASGEEEFVYYRKELDEVGRQLRDARRFATALVDGAKKLVGGTQKLILIRGSRPVASGKVLGAGPSGIQMAHATGEDTIPYDRLAGLDRLRIAFLALDANLGEDHRAAALYFIVNGLMKEAKAEIEAARILGEDVAGIESRREAHIVHLEKLADADIQMARVYGAQPRKALKALDQAVSRAPWYARARLRLGSMLVETGKHAEGLRELETALALGSDDPELHFFVGEAHRAARQFEEARRAFARYIEVAKEEGDHLKTARARIAELSEQAMQDRAKDLLDRAKVAYRRDRWEQAIDLYGKIYELSPKETDALYYMGMSYLELNEMLLGYGKLKEYLAVDYGGRRTTACKRQIKALEKSYRSSALSVDFLNRAIAERDLGNYEPAITLFDKSVNAAPLNADTYLHRAQTWMKIGERDESAEAFGSALKDYEAVATIDPKQTLVLEGQALCYYYLSEYDRALAYAKAAIEKHPNRWQSYNVAGLVYYARKKYESAISFYDDAIKKSPDVVVVYFNKMVAFEALGRYDDVLYLIEVVNTKRPTQVQIASIQGVWERVMRKKKESEGDE